MKKRKKNWCPAKGENHEEFYRANVELRTKYWREYFSEEGK